MDWSAAQSVLYSDGQGSDNPYEKLRIKIEPTRLAVKVDPVEYIPTSPASSQNGSHATRSIMFIMFQKPSVRVWSCTAVNVGVT